MAPGGLILITILAVVSLAYLQLHGTTASTTPSTKTPKDSLIQSSGPAPRMPREKLTHLRFFWHDLVTDRDPTAIQVAAAPTTKTSMTGFGAVFVIDDPMTEDPDVSSRLVGRAQGMYASASKNPLGLLVAQTFAFTVGKYNGSSLTVLGRNPVFSAVREMPIVGGSGLFRWARGYVQARTHSLDKMNAHVEYNVYAIHY